MKPFMHGSDSLENTHIQQVRVNFGSSSNGSCLRREEPHHSGVALVTRSMYFFMASSFDVPFKAFQASHFARASSCTAQGWEPVTSPSVACL